MMNVSDMVLRTANRLLCVRCKFALFLIQRIQVFREPIRDTTNDKADEIQCARYVDTKNELENEKMNELRFLTRQELGLDSIWS